MTRKQRIAAIKRGLALAVLIGIVTQTTGLSALVGVAAARAAEPALELVPEAETLPVPAPETVPEADAAPAEDAASAEPAVTEPLAPVQKDLPAPKLKAELNTEAVALPEEPTDTSLTAPAADPTILKHGNLRVRKFFDDNGNGIRNTSHDQDLWLSDWHFVVKNSGGVLVAEGDTSGSDGFYVPDLIVGEYTVTETLPSGWEVTTGNVTETVEITHGETTVIDFGNRRLASGLEKLFTQTTACSQTDLGYGIVSAGVGTMGTDSGTFANVNVPGSISAAYLVWAGFDVNDGDDTVSFNGTPVNGTEYREGLDPVGYVANVTGLVSTGTHSYTVSGMDLEDNMGAGLHIVYRDAALSASTVSIMGGLDYAFWNRPYAPIGPDTQTYSYTFAPAAVDRQSTLTLSVGGGDHTDPDRGDNLWVKTGTGAAPTNIVNQPGAIEAATNILTAADGNEWDTPTVTVTIPANATYLAFQIESPEDDDGESLALTAAAMQLELDCETGTIVVHKNVVAPDEMTDVTDGTDFTVQLDGASDRVIDEDTTVTYLNVPVGMHVISEVLHPDYDLVSITDDGQVNVAKDTEHHVYIVNAQKPANITVLKDVRAWDGSDIDDATLFEVTVNGTEAPFGEQAPAMFSVWPGTYTVEEAPQDGYILDSYVPSQIVNVGSNGSSEVTVINKQDTHLITVLKSDAPDPVQAGAQLTYTVDWKVAGTAPVTNLILVDELPEHVSFVSATNGGIYNHAARTVTWGIGHQVPGAMGQVTLVVAVDSPLSNGTLLVNTVTLDSEETDPATDTETTTVASAPILTIIKTVDLAFANPGDTATYTVTVANTGNDTAINTVLTDTLPAGLTFADDGKITKTFPLGNILPGGNVITSYKVNVAPIAAAGIYDNHAAAKADNHGEVHAIAPLEVRIPVVAGEETGPELTLTKSASVERANAGDTISYRLVIKNSGTGSAEDVRLIDTLPAGFSFADTGSSKRVWVIGSLLPNETRQISYETVISKDIKAGMYTNVVKATSSNYHELEAKDTVDVRVPAVKGALTETGAGPREYAFFTIGLLAVLIGFEGLRRSRYLPIRA